MSVCPIYASEYMRVGHLASLILGLYWAFDKTTRENFKMFLNSHQTNPFFLVMFNPLSCLVEVSLHVSLSPTQFVLHLLSSSSFHQL